MKKILFLATFLVSFLMFGQVKKKKTAPKKTSTEILSPPPDASPPMEVPGMPENNTLMAYLAPEVKAMPKDGFEALQKWFQSNYKYPIVTDKKLSRDEILAIFVIEKDGSLSNLRLHLAYNDAYYPSVAKLLQSMEKWIPGKYENEDVRTEVRLYFTLNYPDAIQVERGQ